MAERQRRPWDERPDEPKIEARPFDARILHVAVHLAWERQQARLANTGEPDLIVDGARISINTG